MLLNERDSFALKSAIAVAFHKTPPDILLRRPINTYRSTSRENVTPEETKADLIPTIRKFKLLNNNDYSDRKFWQVLPWNNRLIDASDLFGLCICHADYHELKMPEYLIPPADLSRKYTEGIISAKEPLQLSEQFELAMSLTNGFPTAAAILAMVTTRQFARDLDRRIFKDITPNNDFYDTFLNKLATFSKVWTESEPPDPPGNTYYYWTNMAFGMFIASLEAKLSKKEFGEKKLFERGWWIMKYARKFLAREPNNVSHKLPSIHGFQTGIYLTDRFIWSLSFSL